MKPRSGGRPGTGRIGYAIARDIYRHKIKRWLSKEALEEITRTKVRTLKFLGREPVLAPDPLLPSKPLTLGGLLYTSIFNLGDRRKNHLDLLSAFLLAFQDRKDVTFCLPAIPTGQGIPRSDCPGDVLGRLESPTNAGSW